MKQLFQKLWPAASTTRIVIVVAALSILGTVLSWLGWDWLRAEQPMTASNGDTARNVGFLIAGSLALVFAVWRAIVAQQQAIASQGQTETAQQGLLNERYQRGAEMLGSEVLAVRLGGVYALQRLAAEHPDEYHLQIMRLLCAFIRTPTKDEPLDRPVFFEGEQFAPPIRDDVQAAMSAIGKRNLHGIELENSERFTLDLRRANLSGGVFNGFRLDGADLSDANLEGAQLEAASVTGATLLRANLVRAKINGADFHRARLMLCHMGNAVAIGIRFTESNLEGILCFNTDLRGARLTFATLKGADLRGVNLEGADVSGTFFGQAGRRGDDPQYGVYSSPAYTSLTQKQLEQATISLKYSPIIEYGTTDPETGVALVFPGGPDK